MENNIRGKKRVIFTVLSENSQIGCQKFVEISWAAELQCHAVAD